MFARSCKRGIMFATRPHWLRFIGVDDQGSTNRDLQQPSEGRRCFASATDTAAADAAVVADADVRIGHHSPVTMPNVNC